MIGAREADLRDGKATSIVWWWGHDRSAAYCHLCGWMGSHRSSIETAEVDEELHRRIDRCWRLR